MDEPTDRSSYAPFILMKGKYLSLFLSDRDMPARAGVFAEKPGWEGNGYDWTAVARVILDERLPDIKDRVEFDPEAGMFSAQGPLDALEKLGAEMKRAFDDEHLLRDLLSRAELD